MDVCPSDITAAGSFIRLLACVVSVAVRMDMEDVGDGLHGRVVPVVASLHHAHYRPYADALSCWSI